MIKLEDECVGCPTEMGCIGSACRYKDVPYFYCDNCDSDEERLYIYDGQQLCEKCFLNKFEWVDDDVCLIDGERVELDVLLAKYSEDVIDDDNYRDYI